MKIDRLTVNNFLNISAVSLKPTAPVVMVAGANAAGKTSIYQALRLAMLGDVPRIDLMRDALSLVRDGAERGAIQVSALNGAGELNTVAVSLPDRKRTGEAGGQYSTTALRCSFDPHAFAAFEPKERMNTLLSLSKTGMKKEAIIERLMAHGVEDEVIEELSPQLVLGFEACKDIAKAKATEYRGAWKAATGETYGNKKAAGWKAPASPDTPEQPVSMDEAIAKVEKAQTEANTLAVAASTARNLAESRARDQGLAVRVQPLTERIAVLKITAGAEEQAPLALRHEMRCPHCKLVFWISADPDNKEVFTEQAPPVPKSTTKVHPATKKKAQADLATAQRELSAALAAEARANDPNPLAKGPTEEEVETAQNALIEATDVLRTLRGQWDAFQAARTAIDRTREREAKAAAAHASVAAWEAAEIALSPGGIPSELMSAALAPLRLALREVCASAAVTEWRLPEIAEEGSITARGRPYALLSESEQFRVDVLLAAALAVVSGTRIIAVDRADVLEPKEREAFVDWLLDMTEPQDGEAPTLEAAWFFLTLKAPPSEIAGVSRYWIADGTNRT